MVKILGSQRPLKFPLTRSVDIESDTPNDAITITDLSNWSTPDPDEKIDIVLNVSLNEYVALANAIDVGRDIAYGDNSIEIWFLWIRGLISMNICQSVLDCINTNQDIQQAIASYALGSSIEPTTPVNTTIAGSNVITQNIGCNDDNLFGAVTGIVDLYNNLARDIIQILVANTNQIGRLGDLIEMIPVVGLLPVDDALQFVESFITDFEQNYLGAYTLILRDKYRCDLFCIAQGDCEITFQDIFDYFNNQLLNPHAPTDPLALVLYLSSNLFLGEQLVIAFNLLVAGIFLFAGDILNVNSGKLVNMVSALFNDPDPDWAILCTVCGWSQSWLNGNGDPTLDGWTLTYGTYDTINDRLNNTFINSSSDGVRAVFKIPVGKIGTITKITLAYDVLAQQNVRTQSIRIFDNLGVQQEIDSISIQTGQGTLTWVGNVALATDWEIWLQVAEDNRVNPNYSRIIAMSVEGTGDNPFI